MCTVSIERKHEYKHESKAYMKAKQTDRQKSHVFADPMYIFPELLQWNQNWPSKVNSKMILKSDV